MPTADRKSVSRAKQMSLKRLPRAPSLDARDRFLTKAQLAEMLQVGSTTLWRWQHDEAVGLPKPLKLKRGGQCRWRLSAIEAWLAARAAEPGVSGAAA